MLKPGGKPLAENFSVSPSLKSTSWKNGASGTLTMSLSLLVKFAIVSTVGASFCGTTVIVSVAVSKPELPSVLL